MKKLILLASSLVLLNVAPVTAEGDNAEEIAKIEAQIAELQTKLDELKGNSNAETGDSEAQVIETEKFIATFSNARIEDDLLLVDVDFENTDSVAATLWTDLAFALSFEQEGDVEIYKAKTTFRELVEEKDGRKQITMDTKIKSGATAKLILAFDEFDKELPLMISTTMFSSDSDQSIYLDLK